MFFYWLRPRPENKMAKELQKDSKWWAENESWEVLLLDILFLIGQERVPADDVVRAAHFLSRKLQLVCSKLGESFNRGFCPLAGALVIPPSKIQTQSLASQSTRLWAEETLSSLSKLVRNLPHAR